MLLAALEVEGPDTIRIKKGADAGKEISILKMILGDEAGNVCKLTAWREFAEMWGGAGTAIGAKRGDILLIESKLPDLACCSPHMNRASFRYQCFMGSRDHAFTLCVLILEDQVGDMLSHDAIHP